MCRTLALRLRVHNLGHVREVIEAALASQHWLDEARKERTGGDKPPYVLVRSTDVAGVVEIGPRSWLVGLVRQVEAPYLTPKEWVELVVWRIDRGDAGYRAVEATTKASVARTRLSPLLIRSSWWSVRLKYLWRRKEAR